MLQAACLELADADRRLALLLDRNGFPPLRLRPQGFATLVHLILQQQVSRASAAAVNDRLTSLLGAVTPHAVLGVAGAELRGVGFSQQKVEYVTGLATRILAGELDLAALGKLADDEAISRLVAERGVGRWTASVYVLTALGRPDVWAPGDRAVLVSLGRLLKREDVPASEEAEQIAEAWRPWRAVAARLLWHDYAATEVR